MLSQWPLPDQLWPLPDQLWPLPDQLWHVTGDFEGNPTPQNGAEHKCSEHESTDSPKLFHRGEERRGRGRGGRGEERERERVRGEGEGEERGEERER